MPVKQDYPPLIAEGLSLTTLGAVQALCVDPFLHSVSRPRLMAGLRALLDILAGDGIRCNIWLDGSFVTLKSEPADIDVLLYVAPHTEMTDAQWERLSWFASKDDANVAAMLSDYGCDCYFTNDRSHLDSYWMKQFGRDRSGNPKGIAVVSINGGAT